MDSPGNCSLSGTVFANQQNRDRAVRQLPDDCLNSAHARADCLEQGKFSADRRRPGNVLLKILFHERNLPRAYHNTWTDCGHLFQSTEGARLANYEENTPKLGVPIIINNLQMFVPKISES